MLLPYLLCVAAVVCGTVGVYRQVIAPSEYYRVLTGSSGGESVSAALPEQEEGYLPPIRYGTQWATLNVDGWQERDIPVFFGDGNAQLRQGAGMWMNSRFCGQNGKTVLSAHVTAHFYELETTPIGTRITMDTTYGLYEYQVVGTRIFHYQDASLLYEPVEEETLLLYTCYPRQNGHLFKTQRMALLCKKISGKEWNTYG